VIGLNILIEGYDRRWDFKTSALTATNLKFKPYKITAYR
jgi:hypothetical protein